MQLTLSDLCKKHRSSGGFMEFTLLLENNLSAVPTTPAHPSQSCSLSSPEGEEKKEEKKMKEILSPSSSSSSSSKTAELDAPLHAIGFEIDVVSSDEVNGTLKVTDTCCQPFKVLHGGVSALIAEALASIGAHVASGFRRVAGIQLSINHHRSARLGDRVFARATPIHVGKTIQVWEVHLWKINPGSNHEKRELLASSKVTLLSNMPVPKENKDAGDALRKYAKL